MFRYRFPVSQRSSVSRSIAETNRRIESVFGNNPITDVRFLILPFKFSSQLLVRKCLRCVLGIAKTFVTFH